VVEEKVLDTGAKKVGIKVTSKVSPSLTISNGEQCDPGGLVNALTKWIDLRVTRRDRSRLADGSWSVVIVERRRRKRASGILWEEQLSIPNDGVLCPAHILFVVPKNATPEQTLEIRMRCQKVLDRIKNGENFGEMALLYSQDPSSKDGGDLGFFKRGELLPPLERVALGLKGSEVSGIVERVRFHLIKLIDRKSRPFPLRSEGESRSRLSGVGVR
jgi:hypothetical protein